MRARTAKNESKLNTRYVAMCDVLGFKRLVETTPLAQLTHQYEQLVKDAKSIGKRRVVTREGERITSPEYCIFSDSIILWSKPFPGSDFRKDLDIPPGDHFFDTICRLLGLGIIARFPLRIGIAFGECIMKPNKGVFIGQAIVDAFETEKRQEWIGASCHLSCLSAPYNEYLRGKKGFSKIMIRYDVPVKPNPSTPAIRWAIGWPEHCFGDLKPFLHDNIAKLAGTSFAIKWQNTLQYYEQRIANSLSDLRNLTVDDKGRIISSVKWSANKDPLPPFLRPIKIQPL